MTEKQYKRQIAELEAELKKKDKEITLLKKQVEKARILVDEKENYTDKVRKCAVKLVISIQQLADALNADEDKYEAEWKKLKEEIFEGK